MNEVAFDGTQHQDWAELPVDPDVTQFDPELIGRADCAHAVSYDHTLGMLVTPDTRAPLHWNGEHFETSEGLAIKMKAGRPLLLPHRAVQWAGDTGLDLDLTQIADPFVQYLYLNEIKNTGGEHNSPLSDIWYRRHLHRSMRLVADATGVVLDIGCDDPRLSRSLFPAAASYLGLDPGFGARSENAMIAMAEFLPLANESVDAVSFLTSLDHIFDYHIAVEEALRVLKPGGRFYLASLIWRHRASLLHDNIHFHHFRQFEIEGVLRPFEINHITRYDWKGNDHRFGIYLASTKPGVSSP